MLKLSKNTIISFYDYFKNKAKKCFENDDVDGALSNIELCSMIAYNINFIYADADLEELLHKVVLKVNSPLLNVNLNATNKYVLIDTSGCDNHGLTQQYIRAFIEKGVEFAYIYEGVELGNISLIIEELKNYPKATIFTFKEKLSYQDQIKKIYEFILEYKPSKYFMHIMPWDVVAVGVSCLLKGIDRYNINITDHTFWLGATCIDYCIEFRDYGYTVSLEKRGLKENQLLMLPYYPPVNRSKFKGYPDSINEGDVKIFSGGSIYKICGENGAYFDIVKRLLADNENAQLLFAGTGDNVYIKRFIRKNNLSDRIHFIGNRKDILEVFENCDFYLGTYPITGGLMSQFAAETSKAILAYANKKLPISFIEGFVCHIKNKEITHTDYDAFYEYGRNLCSNKDFRESEGRELKKCLITEEIFNIEFKSMVKNNVTVRISKLEDVDYEYFTNLYLEVENDYQHNIQLLIASKLRFNLIYKSPKIFINVIYILLKKKLNF